MKTFTIFYEDLTKEAITADCMTIFHNAFCFSDNEETLRSGVFTHIVNDVPDKRVTKITSEVIKNSSTIRA